MKPLALLGGGATLAGLALTATLVVSTQVGPPKIPSVALTGGDSTCSVGAPALSKGLDAAAIGAIAYRVGWRGDDINIAVAVARAESDWNPRATNANTNGSVDYGLFQINSIHAAILAGGNWANPQENAKMAFQVWTDAGGKWGPWVTYWSGSYRKFLTDVGVKPVCKPVPAQRIGIDLSTKYANGQIPASALSTLLADRDHMLRPDAAKAFDNLSKAYRLQFGSWPCITDSYRSYAAQVDVRRRKPGLAAVPGTSNHGWGKALDLCGPGGGRWVPGSNYDRWMHQYGPSYGWKHPAWAEPNGSKPEAWHWEFG